MGLKSELMTAIDASTLWDITGRRVQILCETRRVSGAFRYGPVWAIPKGIPKPVDGRMREAKAAKQQKVKGK
jgi:hypothetical protein